MTTWRYQQGDLPIAEFSLLKVQATAQLLLQQLIALRIAA